MTAAARRRKGQARRDDSSAVVGAWARAGFAGRGVLYVLIAILAAQVALGSRRGESADERGALEEVATKPFGKGLLVLLAVALAGYALWRFVRAVRGEGDGTDGRAGVVSRIGSGLKGAVYAFLCANTVSVVIGPTDGRSSTGDRQERGWTASLLDLPAGPVLVGIVGAAVVGAGLWFAYRGVTQRYDEPLDTGSMSDGLETGVRALATVGMTARGTVIALAGALLVKAAVDHDPDEARGIDGTLRAIADQPYGRALLVAAAAGLGAFGLFSILEARYRQV